MRKKIDLLEGPIAGTLARLAFPIMGTSFIQMGYNLVDMIWIGRLGSNAVAAVGAAGMFMWLANGFTMIPRVGGQVSVGQRLGAGNPEEGAEFARGALRMGAFLGILYGIVSLLLNKQLIGFFNLNSPDVIWDARVYLMITCGLIVFSFLDQVIGGILAAMGNTVTTFRVTTVGLVINLILDPLLIFGIGPLKGMGVAGAAFATVFAQIIVFVLYLKAVWREPIIFGRIHLFARTPKEHIREIVKIGLPSAMQDALMSMISMVIARFIAGWGDAAVAVITTLLLWVFPEFFFKIFIKEPDVIPMGVDYLRIIGISEIFMCLEGAATGAFQGIGKTVPPSVTGILFNALRIPAAMLLSATDLGLNGVWWALSLSCVFKGTILPLWFKFALKKYEKQGIKEEVR